MDDFHIDQLSLNTQWQAKMSRPHAEKTQILSVWLVFKVRCCGAVQVEVSVLISNTVYALGNVVDPQGSKSTLGEMHPI